VEVLLDVVLFGDESLRLFLGLKQTGAQGLTQVLNEPPDVVLWISGCPR